MQPKADCNRDTHSPTAGFRFIVPPVTPSATRRLPTCILDAIQGHAPCTAAKGSGEVAIRTVAAVIERLPSIEV
jgi:hypothetical protein